MSEVAIDLQVFSLTFLGPQLMIKTEDRWSLIHRFCEEDLEIEKPNFNAKIVSAHRIGRYDREKKTSVVMSLQNPETRLNRRY